MCSTFALSPGGRTLMAVETKSSFLRPGKRRLTFRSPPTLSWDQGREQSREPLVGLARFDPRFRHDTASLRGVP